MKLSTYGPTHPTTLSLAEFFSSQLHSWSKLPDYVKHSAVARRDIQQRHLTLSIETKSYFKAKGSEYIFKAIDKDISQISMEHFLSDINS